MKEGKTLYTSCFLRCSPSPVLFGGHGGRIDRQEPGAAPQVSSPLERPKPAFEPKRELNDYASISSAVFSARARRRPQPRQRPKQRTSAHRHGRGRDLLRRSPRGHRGPADLLPAEPEAADGFQLIKVLRDRVTLKKPSGGTAELQIVDDAKIVSVSKPTAGGPGGVRKVSDGRFMVDQQAVAATTENMSQILTQARALPFMEQGKTVGFRISEIVPGSIYERIGLQNGDVIQRINAMEVDDPQSSSRCIRG